MKGLAITRNVARSCVTLAGLEINQGHRCKGSEYLQQAVQEAKLAIGLDQDFYAQISSTRGCLALLGGDTAAAISVYTHAVELWATAHGENHMLTGWGYMLLGKSYARAGQNAVVLEEMRKGLRILERSTGTNSVKYLAAEIVYSEVLDRSGAQIQAIRLKNTAEQALKRLYQDACIPCSISIAALH